MGAGLLVTRATSTAGAVAAQVLDRDRIDDPSRSSTANRDAITRLQCASQSKRVAAQIIVDPDQHSRAPGFGRIPCTT